MKKFTYLFSISFTALLLAFVVITGCEGPAGLAGIDGIDGIDGIAGTDGEDGTDGTSACLACHDDGTDMYVKSLQASASKHQIGGAFERSDADCASCHTHEGFVDRMDAGTMDASAAVSNPSPPNCRTCHNVHMAYDATDWDRPYTSAVDLWINDVSVDLGNSNICVNCHQPRVPDPAVTLGSTDSLDIDNKRWGPHHGPQSAVLWGTGGYEIVGTESYVTAGETTHASAGCVTCHMPDEAYGNQAGGHTFKMTYLYHGHDEDWVAGCTDCHSSATDFDIGDVQTDVALLLDSLETILFNRGVLDADGYINVGASEVRLSADEAGAAFNYKFIEEDLSHGVHNPNYAKALLHNSIQAMD